MDKEEYYRKFCMYVSPSEGNESVNLTAIRKGVYDIYYSYKDKPIGEDDIKRDARTFLLGMKAGRVQASEIECFRRHAKTLSELISGVGRNSVNSG